MKKALVIRTGAYGDMIILSPLFRALKREGYKTYLNCGKRGLEVLKNNPYIDEFIEYEKEGQNDPDIEKYWNSIKDKVKPDWVKNFSESIEVNVALHPRSPSYVYPKSERVKRGNRNYYDATEEWSGIKFDQKKPDLFIDKAEEESASKYLKKGINLLWCLSGSGSNKVYPWTDYIIGDLLKKYEDLHIITIGGEKCQIIETLEDERITPLAGKLSFRESMVLTKLVDLVISPDTGVLHAAGAFSTPKIGILGHTTIENITKYFENDYSLEADTEECECSPCYRLIYDHKIQCPIDNLTGACWCMAKGQPANRLLKRITEVINGIRSSSIS